MTDTIPTRWYLTLALCSDATFGRGDGVAGLVDTEIEHDEYGCPFLGARALKGLLLEEWLNLRDALDDRAAQWESTAVALFGIASDTHSRPAAMHLGNATLPRELHTALKLDVVNKRLTPSDILGLLTTVRRQTSITEQGVPQPGSLRAMRVLLRDTPLVATVDFDTPPDNSMLALLAACVLGVRRGGLGRNRGRGRLKLLLHHAPPDDYGDTNDTRTHFAAFAARVRQQTQGGSA